MKKLFLIFALLLGASAISIASYVESTSSVSSESSKLLDEVYTASGKAYGPMLERDIYDTFYYSYDEKGNVWIRGSLTENYSSPVRATQSNAYSGYNYKFMRNGIWWYIYI